MARYSPEHKAQTRKKLLETARALFREEGFDAASIDRLMKAAGLTRGGFYAHFDSKEALVREVLEQDSGLLKQLRGSKTASEATAFFDSYLSEEERAERVQCPLVAHAVDAYRGDDERRALYAKQVSGIRDAIKELGGDNATLLTIIAVGAATLSTVAADDEAASEIEAVARKAIREGFAEGSGAKG